MRARAAMLLIAVPGLCGCGSSSLSASQLRSEAGTICARAQVQASHIPAPPTPAAGALFLERGVEVLGPELTSLRTLRAPNDLATIYGTSLRAFSRKLQVLRSAVSDFDSASDPVSAIDDLQQRLTPIEAQEDSGWRALQIPACVNR